MVFLIRGNNYIFSLEEIWLVYLQINTDAEWFKKL